VDAFCECSRPVVASRATLEVAAGPSTRDAMFTVADIDPTATNSPKFRLIAVQCVRPQPQPDALPRKALRAAPRLSDSTRAGVTRVV
jgi:hypothetical protein